MAYVPPHLRRRENVTPAAIPVDLESSKKTYSLDDITQVFGKCIGKQGTLNATKPDILTYVLLFIHPNPNTNLKGEILTHTNIHLLHDSDDTSTTDFDDTYSDITTPFSENPITTSEFPLFKAYGKEVNQYNGQPQSFECHGWHHVSNITYLEPRSHELIEMLTEKWADMPRDKNAWEQSLRMIWAAVTVEKVKGREDEDPMAGWKPRVTKSVNEMLMEMRLGDAKSTKDRNGVESVVNDSKTESSQVDAA